MFNVTLIWTMQMKTDKKSFSNAFYKVLEECADKVIISDWQSRYYGRIYSESAFKIRKHYENVSEQLDGTMTEDANGLLLELHLKPVYSSLYFAILVFIISAMISFLIAYIPFINDLVPDYFIVIAAVLLLPVFPIVYWLGQKFRAITYQGLKAGFIDVLNEIEKEAERSKRGRN
jgi:hypothetical protein